MSDDVVTTRARPILIDRLTSSRRDDVFVSFASPEQRFLGVPNRFDGYAPKEIFLLRIEDEPNAAREDNINTFKRIVGGRTGIQDVPVRHSDTVYGIDTLVHAVASACKANGDVTVDISAFPKASLLLVLRALSRLPQVSRLRLVYSEPAAYQNWLKEPMSYGVRRVAVVPTFASTYRANQDLVLLAFLGYERDRALGMWQSIEPNRTIAVIGRPSYHPEWEGNVETLNAALLAGLDESAILFVDPRNPVDTYDLLSALIKPDAVPSSNFYIAPLGTKPQTVGLHYFCTQYPESVTVAYASPLEHNSEYISDGIGPSWELPTPEGHK